jgi:hypothetical protein
MSASLQPLIEALKWADRWVTRAGENCCVGRSQIDLRDSVQSERPERDSQYSPALVGGADVEGRD